MRTGSASRDIERNAEKSSEVRPKGRTGAMDLAIREADGVRIRFAEAGKGGSETVVLTSPWPESVLAFRKIWDRLAERFHLVAIDLPGFGQSERQLDLLSPYAMGAFLLQLVKEWELGPVHFVAPDVGTPAALWAAAKDPAFVRSLAIGGGAMAVPLQVGGNLKDIIEAPDTEGLRQIDSKDILGPVYDAIPGGGLPPDVRDDYLESYSGDRFAESARYVRAYPTELPKLAEGLPDIQTPAVIVAGRDDPIVPMANSEFLHERLANTRMDLLPAGHFAWEEVPDLYGDVLVRWLSAGYRELSDVAMRNRHR
jgi:pimeloyl-ACP methyl ester carboxylesterase